MSASAETIANPPAALQALPPLAAIQTFRDALIATQNDSLEQILSNLQIQAINKSPAERDLVIRNFAEQYADPYFNCNLRLAQHAFTLALDIHKQPMLFWGYLRDIASPVAKANSSFGTGVDPNKEIRQLLNMQPTAFESYFGSADYVTCPEARSIFSPAAYLVDLLRLIDAHFQTSFSRSLENRRPDIYSLALSPHNTFDTIPYIQLVIEILSTMILRNYVIPNQSLQEKPSAFEIISTKTFPFTVPFNYPLEHTRANLEKIDFDLVSIAKTLRMTNPFQQLPGPDLPDLQKHIRELQEMLRMSPQEWDLLAADDFDEQSLNVLYGLENSKSLVDDLSDVNLFMKQTKLSRDEVEQLVHQDLSDAEFNNGLSRSLFINDVTDSKGYLNIVLQGNEFGIGGDSAELKERFENLTLKKLDRIHKFIRLARKLWWSFTDLDWALTALGRTTNASTATSAREQCLYFDGINDAVAVRSAAEGFYSIPGAGSTLTVEAWILPQPKRNPDNEKNAVLISSYDSSLDQVQPSWSIVLTTDSRLRVSVLTDETRGTRKEVTALDALEIGKYTHFSIPVSLSSDRMFLNGVPAVVEVEEERKYNLPQNPSPATTGRDGSAMLLFGSGPLGEEFHGCLQEVRIWNGTRDPTIIKDSIYERLSGYEDDLIGYWPLREAFAGETMDLSLKGHHGLLGASVYACRPKWIASGLSLEEPRQLQGMSFGQSEYGNSLTSSSFSMGDEVNPLDAFQIGFWVRFSERAALRKELILALGADSLPTVDQDNLFVISRLETDYIEVAIEKRPFQTSSALNLGRLYYILIQVTTGSVKIQVRGENPSLVSYNNPGPLPKRFEGCLVAGGGFMGTLQDLKIWTGEEKDPKSPSFDATSRQGRLIPETSQLHAFWALKSISGPDNMRISRDSSGNNYHLELAKLASNFSPVPKDPSFVLAQPVISLAMDGKSVVQITTSRNMGLGRMREGTLAFWFKPLSVSARRTQLLFAHGQDDVGITAYLDKNEVVVVTAWSRIYDTKRLQFARTNKVKILSSDQRLVASRDKWHLLAIAFVQDLEAEFFQITTSLDGTSGPLQEGVQAPLSPTEPMNIGGLPELSDGWIAFEDPAQDGTHADVQPDVYFGGHIMDVRLWHRRLDGIEVLELMSRAPEVGTENNLLLSAPLDSIYDRDTGEHLRLIADQWQKPGASCSPGDFVVTLYRQKTVIINRGDRPFSSEYLICTATESEHWEDYAFRGRIHCSSDSDGAGVVFYSSLETATDGTEYRNGFALLGMLVPDNTRRFELLSLPSARQVAAPTPGGSQVVLTGGGWYRYAVKSKRTVDGIEIAAKVWMQENTEPESEQILLSSTHSAHGTVGLWSLGAGETRYDDLMIYRQGSWLSLFAEGFEKAQNNPLDEWLDIQTHLTPFAPLSLSLPNECLGFDTFSQESEQTALYLGQPELFQSWTSNQRTSIRGRMMFETDGSEIGLYIGLGKTDGNRSNSLALVRAPFRANDTYNRPALRNGFVYRLEACHGVRVEIMELPEVTPLHSRWYRFEIDILSSRRVGAKIWEDGTTEPTAMTIASFANWKPRKNTCLGLMGRLAGKKFYSDIEVSMIDNSGASQVSTLPISDADGNWGGDLAGFGIVKPRNALAGAGIEDGRQVLSIYRSEIEDEDLRWENPSATRSFSFCGRVFLTNETNSFALLVNCRVPFAENRFYSIQRTKEVPFMHAVEGYGDRVKLITSSNNRNPVDEPGWYHFKVLLRTTEDKVGVSVRLWKLGEVEPAESTIEFTDSTESFLSRGTVGVWSDSADTLFDSLCLNQDLGLRTLLGEERTPTTWSQYVAVRTQRFSGSIWRMKKTEQVLFKIVDVSAGPEVHVPGDRDKCFFSFTDIPRTDSLLVQAQVLLSGTEAEAGITISSSSSRYSPYDVFGYGVVIRSGEVRRGRPGILLTGFGANGEKLKERVSFASVNAATNRNISDMEIVPNVWYNVLVLAGETKSVEGDILLRISAKVWRVDDVEPSYFAVVGYTSNNFHMNEFGLYSAGSNDKRFRLSEISNRTDLVASGNRVWQSFGWVNAKTASLKNSVIQSYFVQESPDDSLLWLRDEEDGPNRAQRSHLDFSGDKQFITSELSSIQSWTFQAIVIPRGQNTFQPILSLPSLMLTVWIGSVSESTVNVQVGQESRSHSYNPQEWTSLKITVVVKLKESVQVDFHGIASYDLALPRTELLASPSPDYLYVGRGERDESGGEKRMYFDGQMSRVILLSRVVSSIELNSFRSMTHASIVKRESDRGFLQASWPSLSKSKQFVFGGPRTKREPLTVTELLRSVTVERSAWASQALVLVFDSQDKSSGASLTVPFEDPSPSNMDLRSRTVQVVFLVKDATQGTKERPQLLYREGQIQFAITDGKLFYIVGYDSLSDAMKSSSESVLSVDIGSNQWYAAALTLEAGKYTRPGAVMAYLDGSAVSVADGRLLPEHGGQQCLLGGGSFEGSILSVQVLASVASAGDVAAFTENPRLSPEKALLSLSNSSLLPYRDMAKVEELAVSRRVSSKFESISMFDRLENIAYLNKVMKIHDLDASQGVSLVGPIKEVGRKDGRTPLFDLLFNIGFQEDTWSSQMTRVPWSLNAESIPDIVAKIRLVRASGYPKAEFDDLLEYLGVPTAIDGDFLQQLANVSGLSKLFGIEPKRIRRFLEVMSVDPMKIGIRDVLNISERLMWFQSRNVSVDLLLQLLGLDDTGNVSSEDMNELVQANAADVDNYRISAEALQSELLSAVEVELLVDKLVDVKIGVVCPQKQLLSKLYFRGASLESMRKEESWRDILLAAWLDMFMKDLDARISEEGFQEFGSLHILVNGLINIGVLFGPALHEELSRDQLLLKLQESKVEGPQLQKTPEVIGVLDTLVDDVIPVWAQKVEDVEKKILERRALMDDTTVNGIANLSDLDAGTISRVFQIPDFVAVASVVSNLLDKPEHARKEISSILQVGRITAAFEMSDVELEAYVRSQERSQVFGITMGDTLTTLDITSVISLSAYRDLREYLNLGRDETDSGAEDLIHLLRGNPSFDQGDLIANTFSWDVHLTERTLQEVTAVLEKSPKDKIDVLSLWYVMRLFKLSSELSLELRQMKLFGSSASVTWKHFEDLATLSRGSLRSLTSEDVDDVESEIFAAAAPSARDSLLGVIESDLDKDILDPNAGGGETDREISSDSISLAVSDFILLDVQTAPVVLVSRVQQAIQSTQLFINKALLREESNLLKEESREVVKKHWDTWMKNYRIWEAARRVFLYPENYIEPELRFRKTPEFQQLEDHVSGGGESDSISAAVAEYVSKTGHVLAQLRVAGAGFYRDESDESSDVVERLMVVGRTTGEPRDTYVRQRLTTKGQTNESSQMQELTSRWGHWEKVDQVLTSEWISPCYAFGSMHLFWVEWQPKNSLYYVLREDYIGDLKLIEDEAAQANRDAKKDEVDGQIELNVAVQKRKRAKENLEKLKNIPSSFQKVVLENFLKKEIKDQDGNITTAKNKIHGAGKVIDSYEFYASLFEDPGPLDLRQAKKLVENSDQSTSEVRLVQKDLLDKEMSTKNDETRLENFWGKFVKRENRPPFVSVPVLSAALKYVRQGVNGSWTTPQSYPGVQTTLLGDIKLSDSDQEIPGDHRKPGWQRLYCMRAAVSGDRDERQVSVKNPLVFDAANSAHGIQIPMVQEVATVEFLAKLGLLGDTKPFSRSLTFYNTRVVNGLESFDARTLAERKLELTNLGFFGRLGVEEFSISLMSVSSGSSAPKGTVRVEPFGTLEPNGIQEAYELIDEVLQKGSDGVSLSQKAFESALIKFTNQTKVLKNEKAKEDLEALFGESDALIILSTLAAGSAASEKDLLKTSAIFKEKATFKSLHLGICYHGSDRDRTGVAMIPDRLLRTWIHYVVSLTGRNDRVRIRARALEKGIGDFVTSFPLSESLEGSDTITAGDAEFSLERGKLLLCEISEARAWKQNPLQDEYLTEWEGRRMSEVDLEKAKGLGLLNYDGLYSLPGPNRGGVSFRESLDLSLTRTVVSSAELSRERVLFIHNGNVYSIENSSLQVFPVSVPTKPLPSSNIGVVIEPNSETSNSPTATVYAVNRISLPPLSPQDSPESLDFYGGSRDFDINPVVISNLQKQTMATEGDNIALLNGLKWKSASVQPVQNMMGGFIVETGDESVLMTANARSNADRNKPATRTVAELLKLEQGADGENSRTLTQITDPNPPYWGGFKAVDRFAVERISAPALHSVRERFVKGGPAALFRGATQTETESPANDSNETFSSKFLTSSSERHLEFVRIGAENQSFRQSDNKPLFFDRIDFMGSNATYYWELFFHIPMLIGDSLNANSQYADSRKWLDYVFDPTGPDDKNPWNFVPFRQLHASAGNGDPFVDILGNRDAVRQFRERPFDAHLIASTRNFSYQKSVFVKYVNNLLDEGDSLFIDDRESINESLLSYFLAAKVLGSRPREIPRTRKIRDATFRSIRKARSKLLESFVIPAKPKTEDNNVVDLTALTISFCVPENERLLTLWNRVEDRLYKIRNSLDINGTFRQLDLFSPPIDPSVLVAAFAAGNNARDAIQQLNRPVPHYRFDNMLAEAISAVEVTMELGSQLLSALESYDAEALSIIEANQRRKMAKIAEVIGERKLTAARHERQALEVTYRKIDNEVTRYEGFLNKGKSYTSRYIGLGSSIAKGGLKSSVVDTAKNVSDFNVKQRQGQLQKAADEKNEARAERQDKAVKLYLAEKEKPALKVSKDSGKNRTRALSLDSAKAARKNADLVKKTAVTSAKAGSDSAAAATSAIPDARTGVSGLGGHATSSFGGEKLSRNLELVGIALETASTIADIATQIMELNKEKALTIAGWQRSLLVAQMDRLEVDERLAAAVANEEAAANEEVLAQDETLNAEQTYLYLEQKFSNTDLYLWLSNRLKRIYRSSYQLALQTAKETERALQFELPTERTFVNGNSWSSARNGLLAAEMLRVDLQRMKAYKTEQHSRFLEVERKISMRNELPEAWRALLDSGECEFEFSEQLFDEDFPGHYFRVLKTVAVTVLTGRNEIERVNSLRGTLEQLKNRVVMNTNVDTVRYLLNLSGASRPNTTDLRSNWKANQAVILSKWVNDTGMFVVDFFKDDRYFPFEGTGAVSSWRLSIPPSSNVALAGENATGLPALDSNDTDVIFTVKYSSKSEGGPFVAGVVQALDDARAAAEGQS